MSTGEEKPVIFLPTKTYKDVVMFESCEIEAIEKMDVRPDDIWVDSFPRSGTTLTQVLTYLIATKDFEGNRTIQLDERFPIIDVTDSRFPYYKGVKHFENMTRRRFIKSHLHFTLLPEGVRQNKGKIIYITRNPRDSVISLYKFLKYLKQFGPESTFEQFFDLFIKGEGMYAGPWWTHVKQFLEHRDKPNVLFLKYEDVVGDMETAIKNIAKFLDTSLTDEEVQKIKSECSIKSMKENENVNFSYQSEIRATDQTEGGLVDKGKAGGWKDVLTEEMSRQVDEMLKRENLTELGYCYS